MRRRLSVTRPNYHIPIQRAAVKRMARASSRRALFLCLLVLLQEFGPAHFAKLAPNGFLSDREFLESEDMANDQETGSNLVPQPPKTQSSTMKRTAAWIKNVYKVVKCGSQFTNAATSLASLAFGIYQAIEGCCGRFPEACEYRDEFNNLKTQVEEKSVLADNLQLQAKNLQVWVENNIDKYSELYDELMDINREQDLYLESINPNIETTLNNEEKNIMDAIKAKNNTKEELDYLQVSDMYESAIDNAMNIGFPLLGLLVSGGFATYKYAKKNRAQKEVFKLERRNAIRLKTSPDAKIAKRKTNLITSFKTAYRQIKNTLNTKFARSIKIVKGLGKAFGIALGFFSSGMEIYSIISTLKECEKRRDNAKEARDFTAKALANFDEAIKNITTSKNIMYSAFEEVRKELVAEDLMKLLVDIKQVVDNTNPTPELIEAANGIENYRLNMPSDISPNQTYDHQINLIKSLRQIPFTLSCYTQKVKMLTSILNGCRDGTKSFDELYSDATSLFGSEARRCERKIGAFYVTKETLKTKLETVMKKENLSPVCRVNNPTTKSLACMKKSNGQTAEDIAAEMEIDKDVIMPLLEDCPEEGLNPKQVEQVCNLRELLDGDNKQVASILGFDLAKVKEVVCPSGDKPKRKNTTSDKEE
ncbi:uncharacterized protein LOC116604809 [Nematostella vectensis]|uniref:uncharacterized protein LOC116604809 n=1 Tax=Nematostella vectensis TaxID=45351 RepID=UPI00138FFE00|nr:uncharacterized protein LOC116604809 [Nematostella vectensis]